METIGLMMIVKNEVETLPRLAASLEDQIDRWTIVDTGSTDGTMDLVRDLFAGIPGELLTAPWEGFGPGRNVALNAARPHSDWVLRMDADETLHGRIPRHLAVEYGAVEAEVRWPPEINWIPRLLRTDLDWRWIGRTREYVACTMPTLLWRTEQFWVEHHGDHANVAGKYERDVALLEQDLVDFPGDPRTMFNLARTYHLMGHLAKALAWDYRRCSVQNWPEEDWYANYRLGVCLLQVSMTDLGRTHLMNAWKTRPWRAEPLVVLAQHYRASGDIAAFRTVCDLANEHCRDGTRDDRLFLLPNLLDQLECE